MAFCKNCGNQISDQAVMCPMCGTMVSAPVNNTPKATSGNFLWAVLGFFVPLAGLILFIVWKNDRPGDAKMAGIGALVGFILNIITSVLWGVIVGLMEVLLLEGSYYYY
ncbi:MAG: zinc-ribbon domain-containing protein [Clostridia bacterium]|nr:zinc-ribbon domain-containing protein [Clostridia bacterium]